MHWYKKIILKNKKTYYFDIFINKKYCKKQLQIHNHTHKQTFKASLPSALVAFDLRFNKIIY
jgi:hypothetical protein